MHRHVGIPSFLYRPILYHENMTTKPNVKWSHQAIRSFIVEYEGETVYPYVEYRNIFEAPPVVSLCHLFVRCRAILHSDASSDIYLCQIRTNRKVRLRVIQ